MTPEKRKIVFISGLLVLFFWLAGYIAFSVAALSAHPADGTETTDTIIVLTGGNHRIKTGLELFAEGRARHLFISGVHPHVSKQDITAMWDGDTALPPCCLSIGYDSTTTLQNAMEVRKWMRGNHYTSLRLVTSGYHMSRAAMEFRHALPGVTIIQNPVPHKDYGALDKKFWVITFSEYNKVILRSLLLALIPESRMEEDRP